MLSHGGAAKIMDDKGPSGPTIIIGGEDRRAADRVGYEVEAHLKQGDHEIVGHTENVSASGAFFSVPTPMAVGSRVHVRFKLPAGDFEASGTIVRMRPSSGAKGPGVGVMFHEVIGDHRARLDAFCPPAKPIVRHSPG